MDDIFRELKYSRAGAYIYILRSQKDNGIYIGSTRNLIERFKLHSSGKVKSTKNRRPFLLIYFEEFDDYREAFKRESYLKTGTGRDWIKQNVIPQA